MNHKRHRPQNRRAGCLLCKPDKMNGWPRREPGQTGFRKIRREAAADAELRAAQAALAALATLAASAA